MHKKLNLFLVKSIIVLFLIHAAYFVYGYLTFIGLKGINIYTEFYRFKFFDDVSISHFFVSGLFLLLFLVFLLRNHSKQGYNAVNLLKIGAVILFISFLTFSFFISYSFGVNAKLKSELSETDFNKDKTLLNVLNPFLYNYTSYSSNKLFNYENILYPEPYPVLEQTDTTFYDIHGEKFSTQQTNYFSIDTLKMLTSSYQKFNKNTDFVFERLGLDKEEFAKRIISKKIIKDSTEIIFKGRLVYPDSDQDICIFLENKMLYKPISDVSIEEQQHQNAVKRYELLYKYKVDSLLYSFYKLDTLFKKYNIESQIKPKELTKDAFYYRNNNDEPLNAIRNTFDRDELKEKIDTVENLFYKPSYLHSSIQFIFFSVILIVWAVLFLLFILWNYKNKKKLSKI
ncbi:hypothetical protein [Flavobacterium reichenbachii]|uniref:Uncharacterized protein n=1 Tax=Flavobacterium reichenbachii TaxID=362418 RepID=A0A085ZG48_9FLAO|nr:hypothetical protein [Flavobacterium reichenbachii]KFF03412.1 hypothetical protein IW19_21220 [Flavobacterium reichenbachii]OXB16775.1 hypothetical protein B0A68_06505 [Flavobacterium reichenbachii]